MGEVKKKFLVTMFAVGCMVVSSIGYGVWQHSREGSNNHNPDPNPFGNGGGSNPQPSNPSWNQTPTPTPPATGSDGDKANLVGKISPNGGAFYGACGQDQQDVNESYLNGGTGAAPDVTVSFWALVLQPDGTEIAIPVPACVSPNGDSQAVIGWIGSHAVLNLGDIGPGQATGVFSKDGYTKTDGKQSAMMAVISWDGSNGQHQHHSYVYFSDCTTNGPACAPQPPSNIGGLN